MLQPSVNTQTPPTPHPHHSLPPKPMMTSLFRLLLSHLGAPLQAPQRRRPTGLNLFLLYIICIQENVRSRSASSYIIKHSRTHPYSRSDRKLPKLRVSATDSFAPGELSWQIRSRAPAS